MEYAARMCQPDKEYAYKSLCGTKEAAHLRFQQVGDKLILGSRGEAQIVEKAKTKIKIFFHFQFFYCNCISQIHN